MEAGGRERQRWSLTVGLSRPPALPPSSPFENHRRIHYERRRRGRLSHRWFAGSGHGGTLECRQIEPDQCAASAACRANERGAGQDAAGERVPGRAGIVRAVLPGGFAGVWVRARRAAPPASGRDVRRADGSGIRTGWQHCCWWMSGIPDSRATGRPGSGSANAGGALLVDVRHRP